MYNHLNLSGATCISSLVERFMYRIFPVFLAVGSAFSQSVLVGFSCREGGKPCWRDASLQLESKAGEKTTVQLDQDGNGRQDLQRDECYRLTYRTNTKSFCAADPTSKSTSEIIRSFWSRYDATPLVFGAVAAIVKAELSTPTKVVLFVITPWAIDRLIADPQIELDTYILATNEAGPTGSPGFLTQDDFKRLLQDIPPLRPTPAQQGRTRFCGSVECW
jgi:hypothetical protein